MKYIVLIGNPIDGIDFYGPFETAEIAIEWAEEEDIKEDWWVGELRNPNGEANDN